MTRLAQALVAGIGPALLASCSSVEQPNTFTLTADLPPGFAYVASAAYVPEPGQDCKLGKWDNLNEQFNREWRTEYKPEALIEVRRVSKGCKLMLNNVDLVINASYGKSRGDFSRDRGLIAIRPTLKLENKNTFNADGESELNGQCQWFFRTSGKPRILRKILYCKNIDPQGNVTKYRPFAAYTLDQLPGKTVKLKITLADTEEPYMGDTWVQVPGGWKRCMGKGFEDQYAFCRGNYKDFSTFKMPDGRECTIYPGCTENQEVTP